MNHPSFADPPFFSKPQSKGLSVSISLVWGFKKLIVLENWLIQVNLPFGPWIALIRFTQIPSPFFEFIKDVKWVQGHD